MILLQARSLTKETRCNSEMKRKILSTITLLAIILAVPMFSWAAGGADVVTSATPPKTSVTTVIPPKTSVTTVIPPKTGTTTQTSTRISAFPAEKAYTLAEMLTYAIKDEYAAKALYSSATIIDSSNEPFKRLLQEENGLIDQLTKLLKDNGVAMPDLTAVLKTQPITSLKEVYQAGIEAEKISIEMYRAFLTKDNLPDGVRYVFQLLLGASQNHLDALTAKAGEEGWLQITQNQGDRDDDDKDSEYEVRDDDDDDKENEDRDNVESENENQDDGADD
jgi:hypothetical protein